MRLPYRLILPLGYMGGIHMLSSIPDDGAAETVGEQLLQWVTPAFQNLLHIPLFGGLAIAWYWALGPNLISRHAKLVLVFLITGAYSFLDEWHQLHVPGRFGSLTDIALNLTGVGAALLYLTSTSAGKQRMALSAFHNTNKKS